MKYPNVILPFLALSATHSVADLIIYEPFDYQSTGTNGDGAYLGDGSQSGAAGLEGSWSQIINTTEMEVLEGGLEFTDEGGNSLSVTGNSILRSNRAGTSVMSSAVTAEATAELTADNTTMWMSFLYVDNGFSGPDSSVTLASEALASGNSHALDTAGYGVGIVIGEPNSGGVAATVDTGYYLNTTAPTVASSELFPSDSEGTVFLLAAKINWKPDGTEDEIFVFNITDLTTEPSEADAIASDVFDMPLTAQESLDTLNIGETQIDGFDEIRFGTSFSDVVGGSVAAVPSFALTIQANSETSGSYDFTWESQVGLEYDLVSSTDLSTPPSTWEIWQEQTGFIATGTESSLIGVPGGGDAMRFFAVIEKEAPAILDEDFEEDDGGFTFSAVAGTDWAWGTPSSAGFGGSVSSGNGGSANCWGTDIGAPGFYVDPTTESCLRSPNLDLTGYSAIELSFAESLDVHGSDTAELKLFNAADDSELGTVYTAVDVALANADWAEANGGDPIDLSLGAGLTVYLKWCLSGVGSTTDDYMGWYIDDVLIEGTP